MLLSTLFKSGGRLLQSASMALPGTAAVREDAVLPLVPPIGPRVAPPGGVARELMTRVEPVLPETRSLTVYERFAANPDLQLIPVVNLHDRPCGLINRLNLLAQFAHRYSHDLFDRKPCDIFMDAQPLVVDAQLCLTEVGQQFSQVARRTMHSGFIVTEQGRYAGVGLAADLMERIVAMQMAAARYANPLTGLPGNVVIDDEINRRLARGQHFVTVYFDLNHFKPFNDKYGYSLGDDLIRMLGDILIEVMDPQRDFVGHIGGDDFMVLCTCEDWEVRCNRVLAAFDWHLRPLLRLEDLERGGYYSEDRRGEVVFQSLPTLAAGAVRVDPGAVRSYHEVSAAAAVAKKEAKKHPQGYLFVERRHVGV